MSKHHSDGQVIYPIMSGVAVNWIAVLANKLGVKRDVVTRRMLAHSIFLASSGQELDLTDAKLDFLAAPMKRASAAEIALREADAADQAIVDADPMALAYQYAVDGGFIESDEEWEQLSDAQIARMVSKSSIRKSEAQARIAKRHAAKPAKAKHAKATTDSGNPADAIADDDDAETADMPSYHAVDDQGNYTESTIGSNKARRAAAMAASRI